MMLCNEREPAVAEFIPGTLTYGVETAKIDTVKATIRLIANSDGKINVVLPEVGMDRMTLPGLIVPNVVVSAKNGVYTIVETILNITSGGNKITGKIAGTEKCNELNMTYFIKPGNMSVSVDFLFAGTKSNNL